MNKNQLTTIAGLYLILNMPVFATDNWSVVVAEDPVKPSRACLMQSPIQTIDDGQTKTPIQLIYNGQQVYATTKSTIDKSYPNIGLQIDKHTQYKIDSIYKESTAVFSSEAEAIHEEFIAGRKAKLALGFWPTWPKTQTRIINFSLIGYTKAYQQFKKCQKNGKLP